MVDSYRVRDDDREGHEGRILPSRSDTPHAHPPVVQIVFRGQRMSCEAVQWVLKNSKSRGTSRLVLISIAEHANWQGIGSWPSINTISTESNCSRREVFYALTQLEKAGELKRVKGGGNHHNTNLYTLTLISPQKELPLQRVQTLHGCKKVLQRVQTLHTNHPEPSKSKEIQNARDTAARQTAQVMGERKAKEAAAKAEARVGIGPSISPPEELEFKRQFNALIGPKSVTTQGGVMGIVKPEYTNYLDLRDAKRLPQGMTWAKWRDLTPEQRERELAEAQQKKAASA